MSSHSLIGLVQSFFTKSDVEADDPMMAMKLGLNHARNAFGSCLPCHLLRTACRMGTMGGAPMMPGGGPDPAKVYKTEQEHSTNSRRSFRNGSYKPTCSMFDSNVPC